MRSHGGAVNGAACGAGNDLVCMCDICIASRYATFAESIVKPGMLPATAGLLASSRCRHAACLPNVITGDSINAALALERGLAFEVVTPAGLLPTALRLAMLQQARAAR